MGTATQLVFSKAVVGAAVGDYVCILNYVVLTGLPSAPGGPG